MSLIDVRQFSYTYPGADKPTLKAIDLSIEKGSFVVITGPSGCGKSTLGKALAGFLFQDQDPNFSGEVIVNGTDMTRVPLYEASERVAYVQQNPEDQFCTLTVQDEIAFGLENRKMPPNQIKLEIAEMLTVVGGIDLIDRDLSTLSGGEKQKVAIAAMLALSPDVLILDEPTSNLDPEATRSIFQTLNQLLDLRGITVIIIEHKLQQLKPFRPELIVLDGGRQVAFDSIDDFEADAQNQIQPAEIAATITPSTQHEPILLLNGLRWQPAGQAILNNIDLDLYPGEFISLMGPNGSGKTSLLLAMMGLIQATSGDLTAFGRDINDLHTSDLVPDVGFIFQNPDHQLFAASVWDEATLTLKSLKQLTAEKEAEALTWLAEMGLSSDLKRHPQRLSYGEKRRLNLAAVILHDPRLLLIDEMLIGQDMVNAHIWMRLLADYANEGNTVLLVNHHPDLTEAYCSRVLFMQAGQIIVDRPTPAAFEQIDSLGFDAYLPNIGTEVANA
ncbi:ATP-binding cassette domain-containing protein [bacterium]|nr:ATP-binding cassette domain-containing protein [bacterium]